MRWLWVTIVGIEYYYSLRNVTDARGQVRQNRMTQLWFAEVFNTLDSEQQFRERDHAKAYVENCKEVYCD